LARSHRSPSFPIFAFFVTFVLNCPLHLHRCAEVLREHVDGVQFTGRDFAVMPCMEWV